MTDQICINSVDDGPDQLPEFVLNPIQAPSRERLVDLAHSRGSESFYRGIDVPITRLRREVRPERLQLIRTMRDTGYMFAPSKP
jgi:DNA-binding response OmpR family regulator